MAIFHDDFVRGTYPENLEDSANWTRVGGVAGRGVITAASDLEVSHHNTDTLYLLASNPNKTDNYVEFTINGDVQRAFAIVMHCDGTQDNMMLARVTSSNAQVFSKLAGTYSGYLLNQSISYTAGANKLRMTSTGTTVQMSLDGSNVGSAISIPAGLQAHTNVGLYARSFGTSSEAAWIGTWECDDGVGGGGGGSDFCGVASNPYGVASNIYGV